MDYLKTLQDMLALSGRTEGTIKSYTTYISVYLDYLAEHLHLQPPQASWQNMRDFINWIQQQRGLSDRTINFIIAHLRFFTIYVLHEPWDPSQLPLRKFDQHMPFIPSREEVTAIINAIDNLQAKVMVILMYSAGLRIGEVCNLHYQDISRAKQHIYIAEAKNRSDRYAMLAPVALDALSHYWRVYGRPMDLLFRSRRDPNKSICPGTVANHIRAAEQKLGWPHRFTCHTFRHAFATHFYEDTGDLLTLKALLGHHSLRSTVVYVTLSGESLKKYPSPIQSLKVSYD